MAIKVAFGSVPKDSGTFTFYRNQRPALREHGIELYCVSVGKEETELWEESYADENCIMLAPKTYSLKKQARAFVDWVEKNEIDFVMAINSKAILSAIPHLPEHIRLISRCANAFDYGYRITMSGKERLTAIIALTPRLQNDLVNSYGANPSMIHLIPNGIRAEQFKEAAAKERGNKDVLRIAFVGRLEHNQKGVMFIPPIISELNKLKVPFVLEIAGKGKHKAQLETALQNEQADGKVIFRGALNPQEISELLGNSDIYLFTSQFEGCPNALLEAMMAACVPVCYSIEGITDFIIDDNETGFIVAKEDAVSMAKTISSLNADRILLKKMSAKVYERSLERFTNEVCALQYAQLFKKLIEEQAPKVDVKDWQHFTPDPNVELGRFRWLPQSIKHSIKKLLN